MADKNRAFFCYSSKDSTFVNDVARHLKRSLDDHFLYEEKQRSDEGYLETINKELKRCGIMLVFIGHELSKYQVDEANFAHNKTYKGEKVSIIVILLNGQVAIPAKIAMLENYPKLSADVSLKGEALRIAKKVIKHLRLKWKAIDDLPGNPHLFSYEKDIIDFFNQKAEKGKDFLNNKDIKKKILDGAPEEWPEVVHWKNKSSDTAKRGLPLSDVGAWRAEDARVIAAALSKYHNTCLIENNLCFPEAGPREYLYFPHPNTNSPLNVGILVSGGIAPGINAVIDGITQRHYKYYKDESGKDKYRLSVLGYKNGFQAFDLPSRESTIRLVPSLTSEHASEGGSILGTARVEELLPDEKREQKLEDIVNKLYEDEIRILYIIGGDGSMKAAHALWSFARDFKEKKNKDYQLSVVAVPKTMDNDILWVWQSFGFLSAVERARQVIEDLAIEVESNPRLGVAQLFGSDSGFVVSHAVLASRTGICDAALIPESDFSIEGLATHLKKKMCERNEKLKQPIPYGLVVMAETAIPTDAELFIDDEFINLNKKEKTKVREFLKLKKAKRRIQGQADDSLRTAGLKIVNRGLHKLLSDTKFKDFYPHNPQWEKLRVVTSEPRHLLRAISPSSTDIIMAHRLGTLAVDNAMAGYTDFMISQWLTEYVLVPLKLVVLGRKRIPDTGIFWKSVLAKTGQPAKL